MYLAAMIVVISILFGSLYWLTGRILFLFAGMQVKKRRVRCLRLLASILIAPLCFWWGILGFIVVHLVVLFAMTDFVAFIVRRIGKGQEERTYYKFFRAVYHFGIIPIFVLFVLFCYGNYNIKHISRTEYIVSSDKLRDNYEIVFISDVHYATIQNPDLIKEKVAEIEKMKPDMVLLGGDIVEEGTSKEAMQEVFQIFGGIESTYGTYYVYGNHDRQLYADERSYTGAELEDAMRAGGVTALQDSYVQLGPDLVVAGREDVSLGKDGRKMTDKILQDIPSDVYVVLLDHQPVQSEENARQGVDLQLSGHTHAGQLIPIGYINALTGALNYGEYERAGCKVIVSSGMAGWGFPFRTQGKCEYVTIHLKNN